MYVPQGLVYNVDQSCHLLLQYFKLNSSPDQEKVLQYNLDVYLLMKFRAI